MRTRKKFKPFSQRFTASKIRLLGLMALLLVFSCSKEELKTMVSGEPEIILNIAVQEARSFCLNEGNLSLIFNTYGSTARSAVGVQVDWQQSIIRETENRIEVEVPVQQTVHDTVEVKRVDKGNVQVRRCATKSSLVIRKIKDGGNFYQFIKSTIILDDIPKTRANNGTTNSLTIEYDANLRIKAIHETIDSKFDLLQRTVGPDTIAEYYELNIDGEPTLLHSAEDNFYIQDLNCPLCGNKLAGGNKCPTCGIILDEIGVNADYTAFFRTIRSNLNGVVYNGFDNHRSSGACTGKCKTNDGFRAIIEEFNAYLHFNGRDALNQFFYYTNDLRINLSITRASWMINFYGSAVFNDVNRSLQDNWL